MTETQWRSVLPHLGYAVPPDVTPDSSSGPLHLQLPLSLVRQSISAREFWPIPEPVRELYDSYRPTPLWRARRFERAVGATAPIYVKYEGGNISGSHKYNTALAQAHYYREAGATELVTGTGAGQWGTALAAACAAFGLRCTVFMVDGSMRAKPYRASLMRLLGAEVFPSPSGLTKVGSDDRAAGNSLSLAIGEAVEYAREAPGRAFCIGSGETYSILHQSVIGQESISQLADLGVRVSTVVGCVGAGSNFGGIALPFHAAGRAGQLDATPRLLAAESTATPKLTRGVYAYDVTDATGSGPMEAMYTIGSTYPIPAAHAAGLRFHGAAKLISAMRWRGDVDAVAVDQIAALRAAQQFAVTEMVLPAPESGHALAAAADVARTAGPGEGVLVCVSGHGLLDLAAYDHLTAGTLDEVAADPAALRTATSGLLPVDADLLEVRP